MCRSGNTNFFKNPHPVDHRYFPDLLDEVEVVQVDGDAQIVDGIRVLLTPGHTVGGQSVVVNTRAGQAVITGFCCNEHELPGLGAGRALRGSTSTSSTPMRAPGGSKRRRTSSSPCTTWPWAGRRAFPPEGRITA